MLSVGPALMPFVVVLASVEGGGECCRLALTWLSGNLVGISINLCKSIQKELFINDTP